MEVAGSKPVRSTLLRSIISKYIVEFTIEELRQELQELIETYPTLTEFQPSEECCSGCAYNEYGDYVGWNKSVLYFDRYRDLVEFRSIVYMKKKFDASLMGEYSVMELHRHSKPKKKSERLVQNHQRRAKLKRYFDKEIREHLRD